MASGLQVWSQTAATNSNADSTVNWAEGQAPSSVNDSARALMASMAKWRDDNNGTLVTTGSSAAYTVTSNQSEAALTDGYTIALRFHATVDSSATLAVDSLTAKPIQVIPGTSIGFGQVRKNAIRRLTYSSTGTGQWILQSAAEIPPGRISYSAGSAAAPDELACDGTSYLRATYPDLFAAIGTTFGAADGSHFTVPDITGRVIAAKEASASRLTNAVAGVDGGTLGAAGGTQSHAIAQAELPAVAPTFTGTAHAWAGDAGGIPVVSGLQGTTAGPTGAFYVTNSAGQTITVTPAGTISNLGSGTAMTVTQPTIVMNAFIKI